MNKLLLTLFGVLFLFSWSFSQEADSLLLADFEDEAAGLGRWTGGWGDGYDESLWAQDPIGESGGCLELFINGPGAAFNTSNFFIVVEGDTATGLAIDVMIPEDFPTDLGVQIYAMDQLNWNWQSTWYPTSTLTTDVWNRLFFDFAQRIETIENYNEAMEAGFQVGVEYKTAEEWYGSVYADNIYLLGVADTTSAGVKNKNPLNPAAFDLKQNYPNPFNPVTTISYTLSRKETVSVHIYNVAGELVQTLLDNQQQAAGSHSVLFDGSTYSSSVYYYHVQTSNFSQTRLMLLIK
ncbi:T9SS type A sorting domain-containing protein [candidate division KSB1 bacterium]|nr:T9SS type A sorting domain-containing protein [candidate division KSB1 bacterium]